MGKYSVAFNEEASNITMELSGHFSDNDAMKFVHDFIGISQKVKTDDTYLILNSGSLYLHPYMVREKLHGVFQLYKQLGYKLVRIKLFKPQKEFGRKVIELADEVGLSLDVMYSE